MSNTPPNDPFLSAFLDGALDQEQAELVEKRIANNQGLQAILHAWKEQGNAIRLLPIHQLRGDLSQAVLKELNRRRLTGELSSHPAATVAEGRSDKITQRQDFRNNWRTSLIAITSLAGLILVGFFLLRPDPTGQPVAQNDAAAPGIEKRSNLENSLGMGAPEDRLFEFSNNPREERSVKMSPSVSSDAMPGAASPEIEDLPSVSDEKFGGLTENAPAVAPVDPFKNESENESSFKDVAGQNSPEMAKSAERASSGIARWEIAPQVDAGLGGMGEENVLNQGDKSPSPNGSEITGQAVSIPQVYFVELTSKEQPLALVSEIFSRNQIEIRLPDDLESLGQQKSSDVLSKLATKSRNGLEAIYVIAKRSQLKRAMAELSNSANISGFEVSSSILGKMLEPTIAENEVGGGSTEPRMDDMIVESKLKSNRSLRRDRLEENGNRDSVEQSKMPLSAPNRFPALAQQLQPMERMQRKPRGNASEQLEASEAKESTDSLDLLFQSKTMWINWDYLRKDNRVPALSLGEAGKQQSAPELDGELAEQIGQEEFVQFLLLVRTTRPE
jgi:hypothetical protein